ncbi:NADPH-dependent FMN reductase [Microvirga arabica]|uniref:NADPH-dependent FMN reductase n=1 Tax=Microvirga arabica TaxID=1128671 RepID=UPI0019393A35|nr:NAD(P)H-dependent oxidoreductase [Microvirga arabica]MBM1172511.1 NAD(P)H-dependent oxidoreductase [Microvirga arabica]
MTYPLKLALIYGSTREGRFCDIVANWAANEIWGRGDFSLDLIDPAELDLPFRPEQHDGAGPLQLKSRLEHADAFIIVTPEYNHSYPAPFKFLIDSAYREWQAKAHASDQTPIVLRALKDRIWGYSQGLPRDFDQGSRGAGSKQRDVAMSQPD